MLGCIVEYCLSPARLYGVDELVKYDGGQVAISEGEFDRLLLQQEGFMAVTGTHGCSTFRPEWVQAFAGKDVVVIYDCDAEGQAAVNKIILKAFKEAVTSGKVCSIKNVVFPLKGDKEDKDVTDYFHKRGFTGADLQKLIDETPVHVYEAEPEPEEVIKLNSFTEIEKKEYIDKKVQVEITVCGETSEAFHAVEKFRVSYCPKLKKGGCFDCIEAIKVPHSNQEYIGSCMSTNVQLIAMLRAFCCRYGQKPAIGILKRATIKEFFCHQKVTRISQKPDEDGNIIQTIDGRQQELLEKRVYYFSSDHVKPGSYVAEGYVKTHPKTQQVTFLIESLVPQEEEFHSFSVEENIEHLRACKMLSVEEITRDLTDNVTRIFERPAVITAILLTYSSPLRFSFDGELIRGWLSTAIIGDSGTGKTQSFDRLAEFIGVGDIFSGLTGSRTGLVYALVEHKQKGWQVRIGRYPANSRKLLAVDEVQEVPRRQLTTLSKAMDEGFMQIDRVSSKGYESMTRLILMGNPKSDCIMDDYLFGCTTLKAIFPQMVIRRLDMAVFANVNEIDNLSFILEKGPPGHDRKVTREMLRSLIYWSWNLKPNDIVITSDAHTRIKEEANALSKKYGYATDVPLLNRFEAPKTLARVAVAWAVLDASADERFSRLIVSPVHVNWAANFLDDIYSRESCMLGEYSELKKQREKLLDYEKIEQTVLDTVKREKQGTENKHVLRRMLHALWITGFDSDNKKSPIRRSELANTAECSPEAISRNIQVLKEYSLIEAGKSGYVKLPKFVRFMRKFLRERPGFFEGNDEKKKVEENDR